MLVVQVIQSPLLKSNANYLASLWIMHNTRDEKESDHHSQHAKIVDGNEVHI